jgi:hypothetical protein
MMEGAGRKGGMHLCHAIDEPILISITYRFRFIEGRNGLYMIATRCGYPRKGAQTIIYLIAEV